MNGNYNYWYINMHNIAISLILCTNTNNNTLPPLLTRSTQSTAYIKSLLLNKSFELRMSTYIPLSTHSILLYTLRYLLNPLGYSLPNPFQQLLLQLPTNQNISNGYFPIINKLYQLFQYQF